MTNGGFGIIQFRKLLVVGSFSVLVEFLMGLSDSVVGGHLLGESALAAIGLLAPVMTAVTFFAGLCGVGMGINYALASGQCQTRRAHEVFTQGLWTVLVGGLVLALTLGCFENAFLGFMAPGAEIAGYAHGYWRYYLPSVLLEPIVVLFVNAAMDDGDGRLCLVSYAIQLAVNLGVSLLAVGSMGTGGCALGTTVANVCAVAILSCHFVRKSNTFRLIRHFSLRDTLRIWTTAFGDASSFLCAAALYFLLNKFVIAHYGGTLLPVLSAVIATLGFLEVFNGIGAALAPIVTVYAGERNTRAIRLMMGVANRYALIEGLTLTVVLLVFPQLVVGLVGIDDPALAPRACTAVRIAALGFIGSAFVGLYNSYYVFIEREGLSLVLTVLGSFAIPATLVMTFGHLGLDGVWWGLAVSPTLAIAAIAGWIAFRRGRKAFPLLLPEGRDARIEMIDLNLTPEAIVVASQEVSQTLAAAGKGASLCTRAALMTEEVFMAVRDRNAGRKVRAEVTLDLNDGVQLTLRDDGELFDITDADQKISSLRTFLVASIMEAHPGRRNLVTTGFNRNVFRF